MQSWVGRRLKNYFFLEKGLWNLFLDFLRPHPQIINGRPLKSWHIIMQKCPGEILIMTFFPVDKNWSNTLCSRYEDATKGKEKAKSKATTAKPDSGKNKAANSKGKAKPSTSAKPSASTSSASDGDFYIPPQDKWPVKIVSFLKDCNK